MAVAGAPEPSVPLTVVWPRDAGRAVIDFNPGNDVEERKLVIKSGLEAADGSNRRDAARTFNEPSTWHEDGERKGEVVEPATGVDAEIETGPTEFGGRRRFKNRDLRCGRQIGGARRAITRRESPEQ